MEDEPLAGLVRDMQQQCPCAQRDGARIPKAVIARTDRTMSVLLNQVVREQRGRDDWDAVAPRRQAAFRLARRDEAVPTGSIRATPARSAGRREGSSCPHNIPD